MGMSGQAKHSSRLNPEPPGAGRQEAYSPEEWVFWTHKVEMLSAPYIICHHAHYPGPELGRGPGSSSIHKTVTQVHRRAL